MAAPFDKPDEPLPALPATPTAPGGLGVFGALAGVARALFRLPLRTRPQLDEPLPALPATPTAPGVLRVFGAATIGPLHVQGGKPCQDAWASKVLPTGLGVVAVADGLGSAARSDLGARTAVTAAVQAAVVLACGSTGEEIPLEKLARQGASDARAALDRTAAEEGCALRDLACTLLVIVLRGNQALAAQLGDGAIVAKTAAGLRLLSAPADSEYTNEVVPLTSQTWAGSLRVSSVLEGVQGILAFTDGCQRAALRKTPEGYTAFEGFCEPLFAYAAAVTDPAAAAKDIEKLLLSAKLAEHSEDDKTLVLAVVQAPGDGDRPS